MNSAVCSPSSYVYPFFFLNDDGGSAVVFLRHPSGDVEIKILKTSTEVATMFCSRCNWKERLNISP